MQIKDALAEHRPAEWELYQPLQGDSMLELGAKWCSQAGVTYKQIFEAHGFRHVSLDWNGHHGSIARDLRKPVWAEFGQFDFLSNIGTTEHCDGQAGVWENLHHMAAPGAVLVSMTPYHDGASWWWHGLHYPTEAFFESFCELNGWRLERLYTCYEAPNKNLCARLVKGEHQPFVMPSESLIVRNQMRPRGRA